MSEYSRETETRAKEGWVGVVVPRLRASVKDGCCSSGESGDADDAKTAEEVLLFSGSHLFRRAILASIALF